MSANASGSQPNGAASAKSRDHQQGNQDRKYTIEQKTAVLRVRKCNATSFYEILSLEKTASDGEIKKAYRKLSLLTHPDKNGYDGADEAFKMVSRAFQILSDAEKKQRYDQFGGDPDNRFSSSGGGGGASPFSGFARSPRAGGPMYDDEISPEELFNRFFGGGGGGMGGFPFGGAMGGGMGPQFVFNMGGGPGFTVHRMGGNTPRRRPRDAQGQEEPPRGFAALTQLLPLLLLFILPLLSSLFSGSESSGPQMRFDSPIPPHTMHRITPKYKIDYFVNPAEVADYNARQFTALDQRAEVDYVQTLRYQCDNEAQTKRHEINEATGFLWTDENRLRRARNMAMPACKRMEELSIRRGY